MIRRKDLLAMALLALPLAVPAQEEAGEDEGPWTGAVSLGYLATTGNTETTSYNTKVAVGYVQNDWDHQFQGSSTGADESGVTRAENYQLGWRSAYNFTEHDFVFGTVDWRKDRFAGVVEQMSYALNYGRRVIDTENHLLALGLGAGYRDTDYADGTSTDGGIGRGSLLYNWTWTETSGFEQGFVVETGSDNTYWESNSSIRTQLIGGFNLVLSYQIRNNSDVPADTEKRDTQSAVSIEYEF